MEYLCENFAGETLLLSRWVGVIGELAGLAASTWYRGINLVHIPTTVMGMVDSSIGGKVAINFRNTINAIGNYYHPALNIMDLEHLESLPQRDYISGFAEVIKCAVIADHTFFNWLANNARGIIERDPVVMLDAMVKP